MEDQVPSQSVGCRDFDMLVDGHGNGLDNNPSRLARDGQRTCDASNSVRSTRRTENYSNL
jgi:hypothetical protein